MDKRIENEIEAAINLAKEKVAKGCYPFYAATTALNVAKLRLIISQIISEKTNE